MNVFLTLAFLFFIGSICGWVLELLYRRFFSSSNPARKWINPGFCVGPYVPLYGFGLCLLYLLASLEDPAAAFGGWQRALLFLLMAVSMTAIEYLAGLMSLKLMQVRLWDYTREWGNVQGLICPKFSLAWAALGAGYYFGVHPYILDALRWLSENLAFSFVVGFFFGVFTVDLVYSAGLIGKMRAFAAENNVVVKYENLKAHIRARHDRSARRSRFLFAFHSDKSLPELLREAHDALEERRAR